MCPVGNLIGADTMEKKREEKKEEEEEAKGKGEKERYTHLNLEFQRIARRDKNSKEG